LSYDDIRESRGDEIPGTTFGDTISGESRRAGNLKTKTKKKKFLY